MKPLFIASAAALLAASVLASDPPPATPKTSTAPPAPATSTAPAESPLVAAAKATAAGKKKKKATKVITNDTLIKSGGHLTTVNSTPAPLPVIQPQGKSVEQMVAEAEAQKKIYLEKQKAKEDAARKERQARTAAVYEGDSEDPYVDPGLAEKKMQEQQQQQQQQKPPL